MKAYVFQAALLCEDCGDEVKRQTRHRTALIRPTRTNRCMTPATGPKGPYGEGGGEADSPQHCDHCGEFLDNPLTGDGENYVIDAFREYVDTGRGNLEVLQAWRDAYGWCWDHVEEVTIPLWEEDKPLTPAQQERREALDRGLY